MTTIVWGGMRLVLVNEARDLHSLGSLVMDDALGEVLERRNGVRIELLADVGGALGVAILVLLDLAH